MAYRPDGGTVLPVEWGCGSPLAGAEAGGCGLLDTPLLLHPALMGSRGSSQHPLSLLFASTSGFLGLCSENALRSNPSSATSLLCDLEKWFFHLSELSFRICKMRMIILVLWSY